MSVSKKNIMHLIATNFYGGPEKQIVEHLKLLDKNLFKGIVASFLERNNKNEILEKAAYWGIDHCAIPMSGPFDFRAQSLLNKAIQRNEISLLCTHGYKACVMGWFAARKNNIPLLAFSRGYTSENIKVVFYEWLERKILDRADGIVAVSKGQEEKLRKFGIVGKKNWVIHNAVNVPEELQTISKREKDKFLSQFNIPRNALIVVTAGRLSPEKGHRYLVDAIVKCQAINKNIFYLFCGEGPCLEELKVQCQRQGILSNCLFVGFRRDLMKIFEVMDLFVLPSLTEGLPNVILESFAFAKPVVATSVGGVPELVEDGKNGLLVSPEQPHELADAMTIFLKNKALRESMGLAGLQKVKEEFNFERQGKLLVSVYYDLLGVTGSI